MYTVLASSRVGKITKSREIVSMNDHHTIIFYSMEAKSHNSITKCGFTTNGAESKV